MGTQLIEHLRAALEEVRAHRGKKIVRFCGRSATREYQVESIAYDLGISPEDWVLIAGLPQTPEAEVASELSSSTLESNPHETTIVLTPGSVVFRPDGDLPILVEGGPAVWCAPGDFVLYLEPGIDDLEGQVRELLVGKFREPAEGDSERLSGIFLTPDRLDAYRQHIELLTRDLCRQIGFDPDADQSPDQLPRGESWLAERADSDAKLAEMESKLATLGAELAAAKERIKELEATPATEPAPDPAPTVEPELPSPEPVVSEGSTPSKTRGK